MNNESLKRIITNIHKGTYSALIDYQKQRCPIILDLRETIPNVLLLKGKLANYKTYTFKDFDPEKADYIHTKKTMDLPLKEMIDTGLIRYTIALGEDGMILNDVHVAYDEGCFVFYHDTKHIPISRCIVFMDSPILLKSGAKPNLAITPDGTITDSYSKLNINLKVDNLYTETIQPDENGYIIPKLDNKYQLFKDINIIPLENNCVMQLDRIEEVVPNLYKIKEYDPEKTYKIILNYSKNDNCVNNINKLMSQANILESILNEVDLPEYISKITDTFEFRYDKDKTPQENIETMMEYISNYNMDGMLYEYKERNNVIVETYTGEEFLSKSKHGFVTLSRFKNGKRKNVILLYVNGLLYTKIHDIEYSINSIKIPTDDIYAEDLIVIQFFADANNYMIKDKIFTNTPANNTFNYQLLTQDPKNLEFYCPYFEGRHLFDLPPDDKRPLKLSTIVETNPSSAICNVEIENSYAIGHPVMIGSKRRFVNSTYEIPIRYKGRIQCVAVAVPRQEITTPSKLKSLISHDAGSVLFNGEISYEDYPVIGFINDNMVNNIFRTRFPFRADSFVMELSGYFFVEEDGIYSTNVLSNGPCELIVDGQDITFTLGDRTFTSFNDSSNKYEVIYSKGYHSFVIRYASPMNEIAKLAFSVKTNQYYQSMNISDTYVNKPPIFTVPLSELGFELCTDPSRYMVFNQRRRLSATEYAVKIPGIDQPYEEFYLIINKDIQEEDTLDIFYLPDMVQEIYFNRHLADSGIIEIDKNELCNTFDPSICGIYVNGKIVSPQHISPLSTDSVKITVDQYTQCNVCVLKYNPYDKILDDIFKKSKDIWTEATKIMPEEVINDYIDDSEELTNIEQNFQIPYKPDIIWAIIKKFWIDRFGVIDATKLFHYNDDPKVLRESQLSTLVNKSNCNIYNYSNKVLSRVIERDDGTVENIFLLTEIPVPVEEIVLGKFDNLEVSDDIPFYSLSLSVWLDLNLHGTHPQRLFVRIGSREYPLIYQSDTTQDINQLPKCYFVRLHRDEIKLTQENNSIEVICKLYYKGEKIKTRGEVVLEQTRFATTNIQSIPIDPTIPTGVEFDWSDEFKREL